MVSLLFAFEKVEDSFAAPCSLVIYTVVAKHCLRREVSLAEFTLGMQGYGYSLCAREMSVNVHIKMVTLI